MSTSNVGSMVLKGTGPTGGSIQSSSPAVATVNVNRKGTIMVFIGSVDGKLYAFDEFASGHCMGTPPSCPPAWSATTGGFVESSPAVVNGVVYVGSNDDKLYAFDAAGVTGCSGTPKACAPLATATTGDIVESSPAPAGAVVYVGSNDNNLYAFGLP